MNKVRLSSIISMLSVLVSVGCSGRPPSDIGVSQGQLKPCPDRPNCVNSQASDERHAIQGIKFSGATSEAIKKMSGIIAAEPRTRIVVQTTDYLRAEFTSRFMRFVDDFECYADSSGVLQVRSASRLGYRDFGVNRDRIERLRFKFGQ